MIGIDPERHLAYTFGAGGCAEGLPQTVGRNAEVHTVWEVGHATLQNPNGRDNSLLDGNSQAPTAIDPKVQFVPGGYG